jgi:hypothetical protein
VAAGYGQAGQYGCPPLRSFYLLGMQSCTSILQRSSPWLVGMKYMLHLYHYFVSNHKLLEAFKKTKKKKKKDWFLVLPDQHQEPYYTSKGFSEHLCDEMNKNVQ